MKEPTKYISTIFKLIKLETMTNSGRVNLASLVILVLFIITYTANDTICYLISAIRDTAKTIVLKENISDPYQTINIFKLMIPIVLLIVLCMGYLYFDDKKKKEINQKR